MRLSLLLPLVLVTASVVAAETPGLVSELSPDDRAALQSELLAWKSSPVGQEAAKMGVAPNAAASVATLRATDVSADQLQRFLASKKTVEKLQKKHPRATFSLETPFALLSPDEFAAFVNKSNVPAHRQLMETQQQSPLHLRGVAQLPVDHHRSLGSPSQQGQAQGQQTPPPAPSTEVDWQQAGCVSHVKNQGACGICWIFAALGALEGTYCAQSPSKTLPVLSEQDVMSCGTTKGQCWGGYTYVAYDWLIRSNGGYACSEASVPYATWGDSGPACTRYDDANAPCDKVQLGLASYVASQYENHQDLEAVVAAHPVSAQLRAGLPYFQFYSGGLLMGDETSCPSSYADHELTIVGYGVRDGVPYWKVKNQWGTWWGDGGYAYLERGFQGATYGTCGIESWGYYPIFKSQMPWLDDRRCGNVRSGTEILGTTLKTVAVKEVWSGQCCDACRREPGCVAANWGGSDGYNVCVLKSTIDGEQSSPSSPYSSVVVLSKSDAASQQCLPTEDNVDYPGNDLSRTLTATAGDCCDKCMQEPNCGAYTWTKWMDGSCFLKYAKSTTQTNAPAADGSPYYKSAEMYRCQPLRPNTDFPGEDLKNLPGKTAGACCSLCRANWPCQAFSWSNYQGGTCWLKTKAATPIANPGVVSATVYN